MKLYEEFLQRIKVNVPVIEHNSDWAFLFRTYGEGWFTPFVLMTVQWITVENRVGHYLLTYHKAIHDGYAKKQYFEKYKDVLPYDWRRVAAVRNALFSSARAAVEL